MKRLLLVALLFAGPALAQPTAPPGMRAWQIMAEQAVLREQNATAAAVEMSDRNAALTAQVAALTKERDDLKSAAAKPADPAPAK